MQSLKYDRPMTLNSKDMYYKIRVCDKSSVPSPLHAKINFLNFKDMLITTCFQIYLFPLWYFSSSRHTCTISWSSWQRNSVFATNSNFLIPISLQPDVVNLWYFKLCMFDLTEFIFWHIQGLPHLVEKIKGLEKQSLRLNQIKDE